MNEVYIHIKRSHFWGIELWPYHITWYNFGSIETSQSLLSTKLSEVYAFEVELLKNKVLRKTALKLLQLSGSNMNKVVMVMRLVHVSHHRTEMECLIELRVATFESGGFPLSEMLKLAKTIFSTQLWKNRFISKTKTSKVGPF